MCEDSSKDHSEKVAFTCIVLIDGNVMCGEKFSLLSDLREHIASNHLNLNIFACAGCQESFMTVSKMVSHLSQCDLKSRDITIKKEVISNPNILRSMHMLEDAVIRCLHSVINSAYALGLEDADYTEIEATSSADSQKEEKNEKSLLLPIYEPPALKRKNDAYANDEMNPVKKIARRLRAEMENTRKQQQRKLYEMAENNSQGKASLPVKITSVSRQDMLLKDSAVEGQSRKTIRTLVEMHESVDLPTSTKSALTAQKPQIFSTSLPKKPKKPPAQEADDSNLNQIAEGRMTKNRTSSFLKHKKISKNLVHNAPKVVVPSSIPIAVPANEGRPPTDYSPNVSLTKNSMAHLPVVKDEFVVPPHNESVDVPKNGLILKKPKEEVDSKEIEKIDSQLRSDCPLCRISLPSGMLPIHMKKKHRRVYM